MARHFDTRFPAMRQVNAISLESVATLLSRLAISRPDFSVFSRCLLKMKKTFLETEGIYNFYNKI